MIYADRIIKRQSDLYETFVLECIASACIWKVEKTIISVRNEQTMEMIHDARLGKTAVEFCHAMSLDVEVIVGENIRNLTTYSLKFQHDLPTTWWIQLIHWLLVRLIFRGCDSNSSSHLYFSTRSNDWKQSRNLIFFS